MLLLIDSAAHFLVDGLCAAILFGPVAAYGDISVLILLYNTLAFSSQCLVGLAADKLGRHNYAASVSMLCIVMGFVLPIPALFRVLLAGIGNSIFHVAGGTMTLLESRGKAGELGVFVAPGCIGLTLGTLYPGLGVWFAAGLVLCALAVLFAGRSYSKNGSLLDNNISAAGEALPIVIPALLTCAVGVRAVGGCAVSFPWKTGSALTILMTLLIFAGKTAGGFICDRLGPKKTAWLSIPAAALLIAFFSGYMLPSLAGQFALNLSMPVTLWLIYRAMPDSPAFAFGLAASALWPGTIIGQLMKLTGPALWFCVIISFVFGLWAILFSSSRIDKKEKIK